MQFHKKVWIFLLAIVLSSLTLKAQTAGTISGAVQDETAAVILGAKVTVTNVETGISRSTVTDSNGRYQVAGLIPGRYEVQAEIAGFQTEVRSGLTLNVGSAIAIPLVLKPGQVTQTVEVIAEAPIIDTTTATLAGLVDDKTVRDLPLNGRSFDQLIALESSAPVSRLVSGNGSIGFGTGFTINGAWNTSNVYLMDGIELLGGAASSVTPGGVLGKNMGVDAVQEFKVLTGSYSAQYGKRAGGIINIATRSGTNQIHGSAYEFLRNAVLDARNFFDIAQSPPPFKRNQFGATFGGPIRKDQTFFFGNYEGLRDRFSPTNTAIVPDDNARNGFLPDAARPGELLNVGVAANVRPFMVLFAPVNAASIGQGLARSVNTPPRPSNQDFYLVRMDHKISENDSLMGRYSYSESDSNTPAANVQTTSIRTAHDQNAMLEERRIFSPTTLNSLRFGFTRGFSTENSMPTTPAASDPALAFVPGIPFVGRIAFTTGAASGGGAVTISEPGTSVANFRHYVINQFDVSDQVFHQAGAHSLNFGVQFQRIQRNIDDNFFKAGSFTFPTLESFLRGMPASFTGVNPDQLDCAVGSCADAGKGWRQIFFSTFLQDDYKLRPNLTLNLGLRYELMTVPVEVNNRISNYRPVIVNGVSMVGTIPTLGSPFYNGSHNLFAPRIGLAWDVFGNGKTAVRAGSGMFYDAIETAFLHVTQNNAPFETVTQISDPSFPKPFAGTFTAGLPFAEFIDPRLQVPTRLQYNLSIQQQITPSTAITIGYVGAHITHNLRTTDPNTAIPQILPAGSPGCSTIPCFFYPAGAPRRNPAHGGVQGIISDGNEIYQALQMEFMQRLSHGLRAKASLTYAKNIDDVSQIDSAFSSACGVQTPQIMTLTNAERGLSCYDVRRNLVMNFTYNLPFNQFGGVARMLVSGWQLGAIATLSDGTPLTALTNFNRARDSSRNAGQRPNLAPGASKNPVRGGPDRYFDPMAFVLPPAGFYGNLGRNTMIGPGFANVDLTLEKSTAITERLNLHFRTEAFNLFNRANFGTVNKNIFNANGTYAAAAGQITSTSTTSRQIQFGFKLLF